MEITNSDLIEQFRKAAGIPSINQVTPSTTGQVVPVIEVNPRLTRTVTDSYYVEATSINANTTITTLPTGKDFYLTNLQLSGVFDSLCQATWITISGVPFGKSTATNLIGIANITGVASSQTANIPFHMPIRLAQGTDIRITIAGTNVGSAKVQGIVHGYYDTQRVN